jgi:hypothetical protein
LGLNGAMVPLVLCGQYVCSPVRLTKDQHSVEALATLPISRSA